MDCSVAQLMQIVWKESEWDVGYSPPWQKWEYFDDKKDVCHCINRPGQDVSKPLKYWGITHASQVTFSFRDAPMNTMDWVPEEEKRRVEE